MKTVSIIGLGIIGQIWARHYQEAGCLAATWNRTAQPSAPGWEPDLVKAAGQGDLIQVVVADPPAVRWVLEAIGPALGPGQTVVQSSTIDPESSAVFRALVEGSGAGYIEAPFTGSKPAAEARTLVFYLGGQAAIIDQTEPTLALVSETRLRIGDNRQAAGLKLAMNLNVACQMAALAEAYAFARRAGINDDTYFSALAKNVSYSGVTRLKEPKIRSGDFSPQFSIKHLLKDLRLASATASDLAMLRTAEAQLERAVQAGLSDEDFSALVKLY